jgi:DNA-binding NtrC family response regulator
MLSAGLGIGGARAMSEKILIIDDRLDWLMRSTDLFREHGYEVTTCSQPGKAMETFSACKPDAVLLDIRMPGKNGFELLKELRQKDRRVCVVMLSAYGDAETVVEAMKLGADSFADKSSDPEKILIVVEKELRRKAMEMELANLKASRGLGPVTLADIVGESPEMKFVKEQIRDYAKDDLAVLITGENGVGKDLAAFALHYESDRREEPFQNLLCPGVAESLFESAVFGHERGAFTDAHRRKEGILEAAGAGTVLLNEFVEIPPYVQAKLLVVLEAGVFSRVGSEGRSRRSQARFVAATNQNIRHALSTGKLREDLYFRLNQHKISIPPLRDRGEDIVLLAEHFSNQEAERLGRSPVELSDKSKDVLLGYDWPGNVRQLRALMMNVVLAGSDEPIRGYAFLGDGDGDFRRLHRSGKLGDIVRQEKEEIERRRIGEALRRFGGSRKKAARHLVMSYRALMYKMKKYGLRELY